MREAFGPGAVVQLDLVAANGVCHSHQTVIRDTQPDALVLYTPVEQGVAVHMPLGTEVTLWEQGSSEAYIAMVKVIALRAEKPPLIVTTAPTKVETTPRRHYCRVPTNLPFRAGAVQGEVRDISGNGALVRVPPGSLREGKLLRAEIGMPGLTLPLRVDAKVIRVFVTKGEEHVGLNFERINERVRDHIIRHVFDRQREQKRLGESL